MLGRRVQQIVQQPLDGPSVRAALEALALCSDSNMEIRDVGETMRQRNSQLDAEFVQALGAVDGAFGALERSVNSLDAQCRALRATVNRALRCTAAAAEQAALLVDERRELRARLALAEEFMARFSLTDAETAQLSDRELSSDAYFGALDRVAVVRAECQKLSALPTQTAVNDLLRGLADQEEAANAAVLRWVVGCARDRLIRDLDPAFSAQLKKALRCLHAHPALFDAATGEIARARRDAVGRAFVAALVRGGPGGTPRPIEAHAGDALRYVGDMLAWAHQACASERELLDTLMGFEGVGESGRMLASALEAVARPLEMRVAQTVAEQTAPPALFRISALLAFYSDLFRALRLPADSPFMATVSAMCAGARDRLRGVLAAVLDAAVAAFDHVPPTLDAPQQLNSLVAVLGDILLLREDSVKQDDVVDNGVVADMLDRVRSEAQAVAMEGDSERLMPYERTIFELNVLAPLLDAANPHKSLHAWHAAATESCAALAGDLCRQLVDVLKAKSRLPFDSADSADSAGLELTAEQVEHFNRSLYDLDVTRLVTRLANQELARSVASRAVTLFVDNYSAFYSYVAASAKTLPAVLALLHTPETLSTLL